MIADSGFYENANSAPKIQQKERDSLVFDSGDSKFQGNSATTSSAVGSFARVSGSNPKSILKSQ